MLQTLLRIGEWQSQGKSEWDRFLDYPKAEREDKYGNPIKNYTLPIIFDLDVKEVIISQENLRDYDYERIKNTYPLKIKGGNNGSTNWKSDSRAFHLETRIETQQDIYPWI